MWDNWIFWPFGFAFAGLAFLIGIIVLVFWIWMIVDCARRSFGSTVEKIVWIVVMVLFGWLGALVYLLVVKLNNKNGLVAKGSSSSGSKKKRR